MGGGISGVGAGPLIRSGASRMASSQSNASLASDRPVSVAPSTDFASSIQRLLKSVEGDGQSGACGPGVNTYA